MDAIRNELEAVNSIDLGGPWKPWLDMEWVVLEEQLPVAPTEGNAFYVHWWPDDDEVEVGIAVTRERRGHEDRGWFWVLDVEWSRTIKV